MKYVSEVEVDMVLEPPHNIAWTVGPFHVFFPLRIGTKGKYPYSTAPQNINNVCAFLNDRAIDLSPCSVSAKDFCTFGLQDVD